MPSKKQREVCDNGDNSGQENKEEKVVIGRQTFNRYAKIQAEERKIKLNNQFMKEIALEWRTLHPNEKAKFFVPSSLASNESPTTNEGSSKGSVTLLTRCSPQRFQQIVSRFSKDQVEAIKEMGFGTLVQLSSARLRRDLCHLLVDKFDTESWTIILHGKKIQIQLSEFAHIIGVPEGGTSVDFKGSIEDDDVKPLHDYYFGTSEYISIAELIRKLEETKTVDVNFRVGFMLLALSILLCPNTSLNIHSKYLLSLRDSKKIKTLNWASFVFGFLVQGVRSFKERKSRYLCGCVLFFQLYYYNSIAHGRSIIDCSKPVIAAWNDMNSLKLLRWISKKGGFQSSSIDLVSKHEVEDEFPMRADMELVKSSVSDVVKSIEELKTIVVDTLPTKVLEHVKELKELLITMKVGDTDGTVKKYGEYTEHKQGDKLETEKDNQNELNASPSILLTSLSPVDSPRCTKANEPQIDIKIKKEISSPETSPDPLLGLNDKLDHLATLLKENPRSTLNLGPFQGCRDLSDDDVDLICFIFLEVGKEDFVVFKTECDLIKRESIRCLQPGGLLSNFVINAVLSTIRKPDSPNWFCNTLFSVKGIQNAEKGGNDLKEFSKTARKRFKPIFGDAKLMDCNMIFIPILDEGTEPKHWFLMVVNIPSREVEIWDTDPNTSRTEARTHLVHFLMWALDGIFEAETNDSFTTIWSFCTFIVRHPYHVPKQPNNFDCGMYMLKIILDYENAWLIGDKFDSVNERVQLALRLLRHPNNQALGEIYEAMNAPDSPANVIQPQEFDESRGTSVNRKTKSLQQLDETLHINTDTDGSNDKKRRKVSKKECKVPKKLSVLPEKRGRRGRPPGSRNKPKIQKLIK